MQLELATQPNCFAAQFTQELRGSLRCRQSAFCASAPPAWPWAVQTLACRGSLHPATAHPAPRGCLQPDVLFLLTGMSLVEQARALTCWTSLHRTPACPADHTVLQPSLRLDSWACSSWPHLHDLGQRALVHLVLACGSAAITVVHIVHLVPGRRRCRKAHGRKCPCQYFCKNFHFSLDAMLSCKGRQTHQVPGCMNSASLQQQCCQSGCSSETHHAAASLPHHEPQAACAPPAHDLYMLQP